MTSKDLQVKKKILKAIKERYETILESYQRYKNNPFNKDYIHRLRVEMRKFRALINFLKPIIDPDIYDFLNKRIRDLGKILSPLRDLDTLIEILNEISLREPNLIHNYSKLFSFLEEERFHLAKQGTKKTYLTPFEELLYENDQISLLDFNLDNTNTATFKRFIIGRYEQKGKKLMKQYNKLDKNDYDAIHEVRKDAKKVRYAAVGFKAILPKNKRKKIKSEAIYIQEHLGLLTDTFVSIGLLEMYRDKAETENLKESLQTIIDFQKSSK